MVAIINEYIVIGLSMSLTWLLDDEKSGGGH